MLTPLRMPSPVRAARGAVAVAATALVAAGLVVPAVLATPASAADRCDLVAPTQGFTVLVRDDASVAGAEVEGTVAVGGALSWLSTFDVRHSTGLTPPDYALPTLAVGGEELPVRLSAGSFDFAGSSGTLQVGSGADDASWPRGYMLAGADTWTSSSLSGDEVFVTGAGGAAARVLPPEPPASDADLPAWVAERLGPLDVAPLTSGFPALEDTSAYVDQLSGATDGIDEVSLAGGPNEKQLELVAGSTNILSVTPDALAGVTAISFTGAVPSEDTLLVVKLRGGTSFSLPRLNGANDAGSDNLFAPYVLWNYPDAGPLTITGQDRVTGSILAPAADLTLRNNGPVEGQVVARTLVKPDGTGEIHHYPLLGCTPDVPPTATAEISGSKTSFDVEGDFDALPTDFEIAYWVNDVRQSPDLFLAADGTLLGPVSVPAGTRIELGELLPVVDGGDWAEPTLTLTGADEVAPTQGGQVAFVVDDGAEVAIGVQNTLVGEGRFSIAKEVVDPDGVGGAPDDFTFELWVDGVRQDDLVVPGDGSTVGPVDVGPHAVVELVEVAPADPEGGEWQEPAWTVEDAEPAEAEHGGHAFEVGQGSAVSAVSVTNVLAPVTPPAPTPTGGFAITKRVTGAGASDGARYAGDWVCDAADADGAERGRWELAADETVTVDGFPEGTTCVVTEDASEDYTTSLAPAGGRVVVAADETAQVVVTNDVAGTDDDGTDDGGTLPVTGAEGAGPLLGLAGAALLLGGLLVAGSRRRRPTAGR